MSPCWSIREHQHKTPCQLPFWYVYNNTKTLIFPLNHLSFNIKIHIIDDDVPLLLSLADVDQLSIYYNNAEDKLIHQKSVESASVKRFHEDLFSHWNPVITWLFTETEM